MNIIPSVLIVDDQPDNFDVIEGMLSVECYDLSYATSGTRALDRLNHIHPDLILLDAMMPDLDGIEVCRRIKANSAWQHIPILMVTALTTKEDLARCLEAGADDFLSKPVNGVELRARVRSLLRVKQQYDALNTLLQEKDILLQVQADATKLREDLSHMLVHDLRNPLLTILLSCELATLRRDKQVQSIERIEVAAREMQNMIDSLLTMAKIEAGKLLLQRTDVDLCKLGESVLGNFQAIAAQRRIELVGTLPEVGKVVFLDVHLIHRVLDNLLSNALKFAPSHSQVTLEIGYRSETCIYMKIKDLGRGVSEELRRRVFEKFEVGDSIKGIQQTGLGLAFCKMAVEAHGGRILIEDNLPKGSIFTVELNSPDNFAVGCNDIERDRSLVLTADGSLDKA